MSILKYKRYLEELQKESFDYDVDEMEADLKTKDTGIDFQDSRDLLDWMDGLKDSSNPKIKDLVNNTNPLYFRGLQRRLIKLFDEGEIDTIEDAENAILNYEPKGKKELVLEKRILHPTEYDVYLKDKEYMKYFNKVKAKIFELFPMHNESNIDLLIDKIYTCYTAKYSIEDAVNYLYIRGCLYSFTVRGNDI